MNILLIFFALPIAIIIFSIILQKIFKCPILVASIIFAIFLIVTFVLNNLNFLIATIAYTFLAFVTAYIVILLNRCGCNWNCGCNCNWNCGRNWNWGCNCRCNNTNTINSIDMCSNNANSTFGLGTTLAEGTAITTNTNTATANETTNIGRNGTICTCNQVDNNTISVSANIVPNNNGRCGRFCGTYRR